MNGERHYVINGDWAIDGPGTYEVAGTTVHYARDAGNHESLEAAGPTQEDLHLMVLFQESNPGIEYEFWLPREQPQPLQGDSSPLRQPQPRGIDLEPPSRPQPLPWTMSAPPTPATLGPGTGPGGFGSRLPPTWPRHGLSRRVHVPPIP
uniref:ADAMTS/ADAMTS-like Spacer 1 domain-containing protein n=1 Tax=Pelusios castaneus TaxID=367368 RepID=A0A8C8SJI4_9SAUR